MSDIISNRLESLSNDLLLDIFEYLDAYELVKVFYGLNRRIDTLLRLANLHIIFDSSNNDKIVWDTLASAINPSQIRLLSSYENVANELFLSCITENLRVLYLHGMTHQDSINQVFQHTPTNSQIKSLYINQECDIPNENIIDRSLINFLLIDHGHRFTALVYLSIQHQNPENDFPVVSVIFPHLRRLEINIDYWSTNIFRFLQNNTPNLRSLKFTEQFDTSVVLTPDIVLKQIHEFHIYYDDDLVVLQTLLSKFPCLRRLYINWENQRWSVVPDGTQWQDLIEKYLPHLQQLTIEFDEGIDEGILETLYSGEFWSTKKVNVKMIVDKTVSRYRLVKTIYIGPEWYFQYFDWCEIQAQRHTAESRSSSSSSSSSRSSSTSHSPSLAPLRSPVTRRAHSSSSSQSRSSRSRSRTSKRLRSSSTSPSHHDQNNDSDKIDDHE